MSLPNNSNWGNRNNGASNDQRNNPQLGLHSRQKVAGYPYESGWQQHSQQQQEMAMEPQAVYLQQDQQTYWNNNMSQKHPSMTVSQGNYQMNNSSTWNQQPHYMQQHQQQHQPQQIKQQYSSNCNVYTYGVSNAPPVLNSSQQTAFATSNPGGGGGDPWNWDWDDSSNNSPAASFSTNNNFQNDSSWNWNIDDSQEQTSINAGSAASATTATTTAAAPAPAATTPAPATTANIMPVQNYFQSGNNATVPLKQMKQDGNVAQIEQLMNEINIQPSPPPPPPSSHSAKVQGFGPIDDVPYFENREQVTSNVPRASPETRGDAPDAEPVIETCTKTEVAEDMAEVSLKTAVDAMESVFDVMSTDGDDSFPNVSLSNTMKDFKTGVLSPEFPGASASSVPETVPDVKAETFPQTFPASGAASGGSDLDFSAERLSPVRGGREPSTGNSGDSSAIDNSTPPPGLDRMVLGQLTESENDAPPIPEVTAAHHHPNRLLHLHQNTPPPGLHRMVLGQPTDDQTHSSNSVEESQNMSSSSMMAAPDDIPPPDFHRMVPGESSSPETQNVIQMTMDTLPREQRVVTGVARDEIDVNVLQTNLPSSSPPTTANRLSSQPSSQDEGRIQFQAERCETIGSDNVDNYAVSTGDSSAAKSGKRKENKDRDRHLEDIPIFSRIDQYYSDDDDADTNGYYSDRDQRNMSGYRDDYDRSYPRRDDRARSLRPEKLARDRNDERGPGKDRRRGDYGDRDRDRNRDRDPQSDYYRRGGGHDEVDDYSQSTASALKACAKDPSPKNREKPQTPFVKANEHSKSFNIIPSFPEAARGSVKDRRRDRDYPDRDRDRARDRDAQSDYYRRGAGGSGGGGGGSSGGAHDEVDDYRDSQRGSVKDRRRGDYSDRDRVVRDRDRDSQSDYYRRGGGGHDEVDDYRDNQRGSGKDRRRGDYVDRDRDRARDRDRQSDYYRRGHDEVDDYRDNQRSRPSSRNDSMHDYKHRGRADYEEDRDRGRDRMDRYRGPPKRDSRDMFYPGYNYDPAYYSYYYHYCENLRRTNPAAYTEWCRKYYAQSQHGTFDGSYTEDRGSVHSGRSSANEENKERYIHKDGGYPYGSPQVYPCYQTLDQAYPHRSYSSDLGDHDVGRRMDVHLEESSAAIQRLTPAKFTTAHVKGTLTPRGQLIKILAHYPLDGQPATLEIHEQLSCQDDVRKELQEFPGPLVRGVTHKNNILRYCKQKIKDADSNPTLFDKESYKLIWELLILLIRQNGTVVGTDIAELLMTNRTAHGSMYQSSTSPNASHHSGGDAAHQSNLSEEEVTNQFRDYLIYGNSKEALEWAMKHGLWGHALFLASKMDQRTYANVMTRFANGLTMNDPLQTLYQLMSGRQPASVTCCADEKWGDWRPHLAMILSNSSARPDLDVKTVTTLGDTLGARGNLHAAHFCYLMAQIEFGTYSHKSSKIVLIGSSHAQPFSQFCTNEAIFATEIFEFACSLADPDFALHHLQVYKLLVAKRLMEVGLVQEAVHYAEVIATIIAKHPTHYSPQFIQEVYDVGNMLKYSDPVYNSSEAVEGSSNDPEWLLRLLNVLNDYQMGVLQHDAYGSASNLTTHSENEGVQSLPLDVIAGGESVNDNSQSWHQQQSQQQPPPQQQQQPLQQRKFYEQTAVPQQQNFNSYNQPINNEAYLNKDQPILTGPSPEESSQNYWSNVNQWTPSQQQQQQQPLQHQMLQKHPPTQDATAIGEYSPGTSVDVIDTKQPAAYDYFEANRSEGAMPQITLPGTVTLPNSRQRTVSQSSEDKKPAVQAKPKPTAAKKETSRSSQGGGGGGGGGSWFGGIFSKLPFRPKNQMILPDDKNPSIVWDSDKKRWVNLDADDDDSGGGALPPPPPIPSKAPDAPFPKLGNATSEQGVMSQQPPSQQQQQQSPDAGSGPLPNPTHSGPNKYKMNRGKSFRSNYVDVMNPGGVSKAASPAVPAPEIFPSYASQLPTNYFIPAPVDGNDNAPTDFLTPASGPAADGPDHTQPQQALSRWSSTSSLSREVQKYTFKQVRTSKNLVMTNADYLHSNDQWNGGPVIAQRVPVNLPRGQGYAN